MKRDMDLIRAVLIEVENCPSIDGCQVEIPGRSPSELYYHAKLAQDARLIEAKFLPGSDAFHVLRLTNDGHEFIDAARNDTFWNKAKENAVKNTGTLTVQAVKFALQALIEHVFKK